MVVAACHREVTTCRVLTVPGGIVPTDALWRAEINRETKVTSNNVAVKPAALLRRIRQGSGSDFSSDADRTVCSVCVCVCMCVLFI